MTVREPLRSLDHFCLSSDVRHLCHGSFGAAPRPVHAARMRWLEVLEANPDHVFLEQVRPRLRQARFEVSARFGSRHEDLVLLQNANSAVQTVLESLCLTPEDLVVCTDHNYVTIRACLSNLTGRRGVPVVPLEIGAGPWGEGYVFERVKDGLVSTRMVSGRRVLVIDHVASPSALIFPLAELADLCRREDVQVLVDGAHGPGMLDLDLNSLGRAGVCWYAGNLHKWCCCPRGTGFLWSHPDHQSGVSPLVSQTATGGYAERFEWLGTFDVSPLLALPEALEWTDPFRSPEVLQRNIDLAAAVQDLWVAKSGAERLLLPGQHGSMVALNVPISADLRARLPARFGDPFLLFLRHLLFREHQIEAPLTTLAGSELWIRPSCHVYNALRDYEDLYERVQDVLELAASRAAQGADSWSMPQLSRR